MSRRAGVSGGAVLAVGLLLAAVAGSFAWLDMPLAALFTATAVEEAGGFVARFFPPDLSAGFLAKVAWAGLETLAISLLSTLLAALAGPCWRCRRRAPRACRRHAARFVLNLLRSVPELVWATLMVLAAGLGPSPAPWRWRCTPPGCSAACLPRRWRTARPRRPRRWRAVVRRPSPPSCTARCRWWRPSGWPTPCIAGR
jgi:hypothetical protein